jgi:hypothetical protein
MRVWNCRRPYYPAHLAAHPPDGFIVPCLPGKTYKLPSGSEWLHEIKHDGFSGTLLASRALR